MHYARSSKLKVLCCFVNEYYKSLGKRKENLKGGIGSCRDIRACVLVVHKGTERNVLVVHGATVLACCSEACVQVTRSYDIAYRLRHSEVPVLGIRTSLHA